MKDKKTLLNELRSLDFVLLETGLYLNAYDCDEALAYFNTVKEQRQKVAAEYEAAYGPLRVENHCDSGEWKWTKGPWPWESEAN